MAVNIPSPLTTLVAGLVKFREVPPLTGERVAIFLIDVEQEYFVISKVSETVSLRFIRGHLPYYHLRIFVGNGIT